MSADRKSPPSKIEDTIYLILGGIKCKKRVIIIINNRAGSNTPIIAQLSQKTVSKRRPNNFLKVVGNLISPFSDEHVEVKWPLRYEKVLNK